MYETNVTLKMLDRSCDRNHIFHTRLSTWFFFPPHLSLSLFKLYRIHSCILLLLLFLLLRLQCDWAFLRVNCCFSLTGILCIIKAISSPLSRVHTSLEEDGQLYRDDFSSPSVYLSFSHVFLFLYSIPSFALVSSSSSSSSSCALSLVVYPFHCNWTCMSSDCCSVFSSCICSVTCSFVGWILCLIRDVSCTSLSPCVS